MKVYTVNTIGGQITGNEAIEEEVPAWLYNAINDTIKKNGFCYYSDDNRECATWMHCQRKKLLTGRIKCNKKAKKLNFLLLTIKK